MFRTTKTAYPFDPRVYLMFEFMTLSIYCVYVVFYRIWRKKYGDVFSLYLGNRLVIVLNGYTAIREALVTQSHIFSGRPENVLVFDTVNKRRGELPFITPPRNLWRVLFLLWFVCLSVCVCVCLSICLSVYVSVCQWPKSSQIDAPI